jgi:5-methyltetrahydropteroyltriglutamate--homocysteine methyltransferase
MSDDHISTTHIGSLPRDPELLDLLQRRQDGEAVDPEQWHQTVQDATESVVRKQADVGLDVVNNGEQPRVSFNWYVANRLSGIGGERDAPLWDDLADFPEYASDAFDTETIDLTKQPSVTGPVEYVGTEAVDEEIETFTDALDAVDADFEGTFLTAASPGVAAATLVNEYYDSHEEFVHAVGDALREEYEAIADTGAILHLDAPDLLTTGHRGFGDRPVEKLKPIVRLHVAALNEAT